MSSHLAKRIEGEVGGDVDRQIRCAYGLAYGRLPRGEEIERARQVV
jgi:hypothetical protein